MAVYIYKAMTKSGLVVRNKVEAPTKQNLVKMLKDNDMLPISIDKMPYGQKRQNVKKKKNIHDMEEFMKNVNTTDIAKENEPSTREKIRMYFGWNCLAFMDVLLWQEEFFWHFPKLQQEESSHFWRYRQSLTGCLSSVSDS